MPPRVRPHVLLDCDMVLSDFEKGMLREVNELLGWNVSRADLTEWDIGKSLKLNAEQEKIVYDRIKGPGWADRLEVMEGAQEGVAKLMEMAEVRIVTAPMFGPTWCYDRWQWLERLFGIRPHHVFHTHEKHLVWGHMIVDDKPANVAKWKEHWRDMHREAVGVVWHMPYTERDRPELPRVHSWAQVHEWVRTLW